MVCEALGEYEFLVIKNEKIKNYLISPKISNFKTCYSQKISPRNFPVLNPLLQTKTTNLWPENPHSHASFYVNAWLEIVISIVLRACFEIDTRAKVPFTTVLF